MILYTRRQWVTLLLMCAACGSQDALELIYWDRFVWDHAAWA